MTRLNISSRLLATAAFGGIMLAAVPAAAQEQAAPATTAAKPEIGDFGFDMKGMAPQVSIEMGRGHVPSHYQPSFFEMEEATSAVKLEG